MSHNYCGGEDYLIALGETRSITQYINYLERGMKYSKDLLDQHHDILLQLFEYNVQQTSALHKKPLWTNLDESVAKHYIDHLHANGDSQEIVANKLAIITPFFSYMVSNGIVENNPFDKYQNGIFPF